MTPWSLTLRYSVFAAVAVASNLAAQWTSFRVYGGPYGLAVAMAAGTAVGLVVKYWLDKHWIFYDREAGLSAHGRKFTLYTLMGVITTAIFWGVEILFAMTFAAPAMTYVGATLGLSIGYLMKYHLDRRFVFRRAGI